MANKKNGPLPFDAEIIERARRDAPAGIQKRVTQREDSMRTMIAVGSAAKIFNEALVHSYCEPSAKGLRSLIAPLTSPPCGEGMLFELRSKLEQEACKLVPSAADKMGLVLRVGFGADLDEVEQATLVRLAGDAVLCDWLASAKGAK